MKYSLLIISFFFFSHAGISQPRHENANPDSLYKYFKNKKALKAYNSILANHSNNINALWHSSLLYSRIGSNTDKKDKKKQYFKKAEITAKHALNLDPKNSYANFAMAVSLGQMAQVGSLGDKLNAASEIKKYADQAIDADSTNPGAWFALGAWNFEIANMNKLKEFAANLFSGGIPDGASTKKAARYMQKAVELKPSFILYHLGLARSYKKLGENEKAITACRQGLKMKNLSPKDPANKKKCKKLISSLK